MREDVEIRIDEKEHKGYLEVIKSSHGVLIKEFNEFAHEHGRVFIYWDELLTFFNEFEEEVIRRGR